MSNDLFGHAPAPDVDLDDGEYLLALHHEYRSGLAIKVSEFGDEAKAFDLPLSKVTVSETGKFVQHQIGARKIPVVKVKIPEWLATRNGLT